MRRTPSRALASLMFVVLLVACAAKREGLVAASEAAVADDTRFVSARTAGQTYSDVAATLLESTKRCVAKRAHADPRCTARASAAGFFQVLSDEVVVCDRAGRARSRDAARAALKAIDDADKAGSKRAPSPPPAVPRC